jgi:formimidoylglutamate deiminase
LPTLPTLHANAALLDDGWHTNVRLTITRGEIERIEISVEPDRDDQQTGAILPGIPNGHSHAFQRAMAGRAERRHENGEDFWTWRQSMFALAERMSPEPLLAIATLAYMEMLEAGYTSVAEFHYLHNNRGGKAYAPAHLLSQVHSEAARAAGIRLTLIPTLYMVNGFDGAQLTEPQLHFANSADSFLQLVEGIRGQEYGRAIGLGIHSLRAVPPAALRTVVDYASKALPKVPLHIHIAEQQSEVDACLLATGQRPIEWLLDHHDIDKNWCMIHATHATAEELRGIADRDATIILCPSTEANLGDGVFNYDEFVSNGGRIGIGSDSQVTINPWHELQLLEYSQRLIQQKRNIAAASGKFHSTGRALLDAVLEGGRAAVGRVSDGLAEGKTADLIALNMQDPRLAGLMGNELLDALIFANPRNPIDAVMVGGEWKTRAGRHQQSEQIIADFHAAKEIIAQGH